MNPKRHPNHTRYIQTLRSMTPEQRLRKAFELTELGRRLFADGLRRRHSEMSETEIRRIYLERVTKCHNRIY
jgi:DNA-binding PadR family transcriptional regulator